MTPSVEHAQTTPTTTDLGAAVREVLAASPEPMTVSKIRAALPPALRQVNVEELNNLLRREAAANVLYEYPKYRSQQERYWDRPMPVHIVELLRMNLEERPLPWTELRRKLPAYAQDQAQTVLEEQISQKKFFRHPRHPGKRAGEPIGIRAADPRDYLSAELSGVFNRLEKLGFMHSQVRAAALDILHDEEWAPAPPDSTPKKEDASASKSEQGRPNMPQPTNPNNPEATDPG
ncbi:MAG: hypothetical protein ACJ8FY_05135 [Gemmataceae bacterium]